MYIDCETNLLMKKIFLATSLNKVANLMKIIWTACTGMKKWPSLKGLKTAVTMWLIGYNNYSPNIGANLACSFEEVIQNLTLRGHENLDNSFYFKIPGIV